MSSVLVAVVAAAVVANAAQAEGRPVIVPWYTIGASGYGLGVVEEETVVVSRVTGTSVGAFWIAEQWRHESSAIAKTSDTKHRWIDGRGCPALVNALNKLSEIPATKFGTPDTFADTGFAFDATLTSFRGPPAEKGGVGVQITRREYDGPLTNWRLATGAALAGCWRDDTVQIDGTEAPTRLGSEQEAQRWRP